MNEPPAVTLTDVEQDILWLAIEESLAAGGQAPHIAGEQWKRARGIEEVVEYIIGCRLNGITPGT